MIFRPMSAADLDAVLGIEQRAFPEPWSRGLFVHELKLPFSKTILACTREDGTVLGYICRWQIGDEIEILNLAVHPDHLQRGIGRALVEQVLSEAEAGGASTITLEVRRGNPGAHALYHALGFTARGVRRNYYGRGEDAIIMTRALQPVPPIEP